jgi:two-component system sensor histidine kinase KdpD
VSHDLRSPLAAVKAAASSLASTDISWSAHGQARLLAAIEKGCHRLEHLIENLSNLSRLQMGAFKPCGRRGRPRRRRRLDPGPWTPSPAPSGSASTSPKLCPPALVDPGLLDRVIANVVENALRHTPPSSPITMRITPPTDPSARRLQVRAVDRGDGVPTARQRNLFVPVQRLADVPDGDGLGLGLAVARGMTEALGAG